MVDEPLADLEERRAQLYRQLSATGDFRRGSITENYRRCGKANCACAQPEHPGHGPRYLWTRSVPGGTTKGRQLSGIELDKVRQELANNKAFVSVSEQIVEVNEAICEARPISPLADGEHEQHRGVEKGGSSVTSKRSSRQR